MSTQLKKGTIVKAKDLKKYVNVFYTGIDGFINYKQFSTVNTVLSCSFENMLKKEKFSPNSSKYLSSDK